MLFGLKNAFENEFYIFSYISFILSLKLFIKFLRLLQMKEMEKLCTYAESEKHLKKHLLHFMLQESKWKWGKEKFY